MASYTTNLNLKKPAGSENVAIGDINNNMDAIDAAYGALTSSGSWVPSFPRDTASNMYATWIRIGRMLFITAQWTNTHGSGASYIDANSLPVPSGYTRAYGLHGTWRSNTTDVGGEVGQFSETQNMRFSKGGVGVELPSEPISFFASCMLNKT